MLATGRERKSIYQVRYFVGHKRTTMYQTLTALAEDAIANTANGPLETGVWSIHDHLGHTLVARTYDVFNSKRWKTVRQEALSHYDLNTTDHRMMHMHISIIQNDGTVTEIQYD